MADSGFGSWNFFKNIEFKLFFLIQNLSFFFYRINFLEFLNIFSSQGWFESAVQHRGSTVLKNFN